MKTTLTIAGNLGTNPFYIFNQDVDEVIMLINYYLSIGTEAKEARQTNPRDDNAKIEVNDQTATGGWW